MKNYPAKILLFGEYTILKGSGALAMPFPRFKANWVQKELKSKRSEKLFRFADFLEENFSLQEIDAKAFRADLFDGYFLFSSIPKGYGLGSSGAVCAAIVDRYGSEEIKGQDISGLRALFAKMEAFFHGNSSGMDPLVCYLEQPLRLDAEGNYETVSLPKLEEHFFFLLDTGQSRSTAPLVQFFRNSWEKEEFRENAEKKWVPGTQRAIQSLLAKEEKQLWREFYRLSKYQFTALEPLIPESILPIWEEGFNSLSFFLKLCGAGGGGFMLGMAKKDTMPSAISTTHSIISLKI